jgi:hypothetical protein
MNFDDFNPIADFLAEDPWERLGVLTFGISSWLVAATTQPSGGIVVSIIQVIPPLVGIWVANRSMERAHELRMEKERQKRTQSESDEAK